MLFDPSAPAPTFQAKHTPRPWRWRWCYGSPAPELVCPKHGLLYVLGAVRHGFNGACLAFAARTDKMGGLIKKVCEFSAPSLRGSDFVEVDNPDARLVKAAPDMFDTLLAEYNLLLEHRADCAMASTMGPSWSEWDEKRYQRLIWVLTLATEGEAAADELPGHP